MRISKNIYTFISVILIFLIVLMNTRITHFLYDLGQKFSQDGEIKFSTILAIYILIIILLILFLILIYLYFYTKLFENKKILILFLLIFMEYCITVFVFIFKPYILSNQNYNLFAYINAIQLFVVSFLSLKMFKLTKGQNKRTNNKLFWIFSAFGFLLLAIDELFELHEYLGNDIFFPLIKDSLLGKFISNNFYHPDDIILLMYFVIGIIVLILFRKYIITLLKKSKAALLFGLIGILTICLQIVAEKLKYFFIEEVCENFSSIFFIICLYLILNNEKIKTNEIN